MDEGPSFNLWTEPWITVETSSGSLETVSIETLLAECDDCRGLYDPSPLVVVAIHRLLVAILQDIIQPKKQADLITLWRLNPFPRDRIREFGQTFGHRFDVFSEDAPFLQSADIPRETEKRGRGKSVGYLLEELTAGTAVTHYNHLYERDLMLCAACCSKGLVSIPAFASSGGAGIKPSINGVPPIYVIPGGETYYFSLAASLVTPRYQPSAADRDHDMPWWRADPIVGKKQEVLRVGYLQSLTFPARRVRLYPEVMQRSCSRCGQITRWGASEMVYEMGQSRPEGAPFWQDPFAAYRVHVDSPPTPVRPVEGRAVWREFAALFLPQDTQNEQRYIRPSLIGQMEDVLETISPGSTDVFPFQTIGLRTDMKMKIFEWQSSGFLVTPEVLRNPNAAVKIEAGLDFAGKCQGILNGMYQRYFSGPSPQFPEALPIKGTAAIRAQMIQRYWQQLGDAFQQWILRFGPQADEEELFELWLQTVVRVGADVFRETADQLNPGNSTALICEEAIHHLRNSLISYRNKVHPKEVIQ